MVSKLILSSYDNDDEGLGVVFKKWWIKLFISSLNSNFIGIGGRTINMGVLAYMVSNLNANRILCETNLFKWDLFDMTNFPYEIQKMFGLGYYFLEAIWFSMSSSLWMEMSPGTRTLWNFFKSTTRLFSRAKRHGSKSPSQTISSYL